MLNYQFIADIANLALKGLPHVKSESMQIIKQQSALAASIRNPRSEDEKQDFIQQKKKLDEKLKTLNTVKHFFEWQKEQMPPSVDSLSIIFAQLAAWVQTEASQLKDNKNVFTVFCWQGYFTALLQHEENPYGLIALGEHLIDEPPKLAGFLLWMLSRDVTPNKIISSNILHRFFGLTYSFDGSNSLSLFYDLLRNPAINQNQSIQILLDIVDNTPAPTRIYINHIRCNFMQIETEEVDKNQLGAPYYILTPTALLYYHQEKNEIFEMDIDENQLNKIKEDFAQTPKHKKITLTRDQLNKITSVVGEYDDDESLYESLTIAGAKLKHLNPFPELEFAQFPLKKLELSANPENNQYLYQIFGRDFIIEAIKSGVDISQFIKSNREGLLRELEPLIKAGTFNSKQVDNLFEQIVKTIQSEQEFLNLFKTQPFYLILVDYRFLHGVHRSPDIAQQLIEQRIMPPQIPESIFSVKLLCSSHFLCLNERIQEYLMDWAMENEQDLDIDIVDTMRNFPRSESICKSRLDAFKQTLTGVISITGADSIETDYERLHDEWRTMLRPLELINRLHPILRTQSSFPFTTHELSAFYIEQRWQQRTNQRDFNLNKIWEEMGVKDEDKKRILYESMLYITDPALLLVLIGELEALRASEGTRLSWVFDQLSRAGNPLWVKAIERGNWNLVICMLPKLTPEGVKEAFMVALAQKKWEVMEKIIPLTGVYYDKDFATNVSRCAKEALIAKQWDCLIAIVALKSNNRLTQTEVFDIVIAAISNQQWRCVAAALALTGDNKLNPQQISEIVNKAIDDKQWDCVDAALTSMGDKPHRPTVETVLHRATENDQLDIVKQALTLLKDKRLTLSALWHCSRKDLATVDEFLALSIISALDILKEVLLFKHQAFYKQKWDILKQLIDLTGDRKLPSDDLSVVLREAVENNQWEIVKQIIALPGNSKETLYTAPYALRQAVGQKQWDVVRQCIDLMKTSFKTEDLSHVLDHASSNRQWDIVKQALPLVHALVFEVPIPAVLERAVAEGKVEIVNTILTHHKPTSRAISKIYDTAHSDLKSNVEFKQACLIAFFTHFKTQASTVHSPTFFHEPPASGHNKAQVIQALDAMIEYIKNPETAAKPEAGQLELFKTAPYKQNIDLIAFSPINELLASTTERVEKKLS